MFLILSLPRSRSAWMAHYLNYPPRRVGHDILTECKSIGDFIGSFADSKLMWGTVETAGMWGAKLYGRLLPDVKIVTVHRPIEEVWNSFKRLNVTVDVNWLKEANDYLDLCSHLPGAESIDFEELDKKKVCKWLFEHCLELPFDEDWYEEYKKLNIQIDMRARLQQIFENDKDLKALKKEVIEMAKKESAQWMM